MTAPDDVPPHWVWLLLVKCRLRIAGRRRDLENGINWIKGEGMYGVSQSR